ncbi:MAG TPA: hypothetical protein VF290_22205 [Pyrinomonadaceae bacterium]
MSNTLRQFHRREQPKPAPDLLLRGLEVLTINEGDTVLIRSEVNPMTAEVIENLQKSIVAFCNHRGVKDVNFIVLPPDVGVSTLSADSMKKAGWERAGRILRPA